MAVVDPSQDYSNLCNELIALGYDKLIAVDDVRNSITLSDQRFTDLIAWLCTEIIALYELDEHVQPPTSEANSEFFLLELSSLLSELECPIDVLTLGPVTERFKTVDNRIKLITFLFGHLKCARLTALKRLQEEPVEVRNVETICLENALQTLGASKEFLYNDLTVQKLFTELSTLIENRLEKCKVKPRPLLIASLTVAQWAHIQKISETLCQEYRNRILLLIKRLDVTIQSFTWSDRIKKMEDKLHNIYRPRRDRIMVSSNVDISHLLAATTDLLTISKINNERERKRTFTRLNKIVITECPSDRGGRPAELRAPPPEMPAWIKDRAPDQGGRGRSYQNTNRSGNNVQSGYREREGGRSYQHSGQSGQHGADVMQRGYQRGNVRYGGRGVNYNRGNREDDFENQVMLECERNEYHNPSFTGRWIRGREREYGYGRGGFR